MNKLTVFRVYPIASLKALFPSARVDRFLPHSIVLHQAVTELGKQNHRRMLHVWGVVSSLEALERQDFNFFLQRIPEALKQREMQQLQLGPAEYREQYSIKLAGLHDLFAKLPLEEREILKLAVLAHDLGIPFGIEWDHPQNGAEVVRHLVEDEGLQKPMADLIEHHGEFSNLPSASFPRDIYRLPQKWVPALLLLDFCDATARATKEEQIENPIGLASLDYYLELSNPPALVALEKGPNLFALRSRYGFGSVIFNRRLPQATLEAIRESDDAVEFYGNQLRCRFLDLLIFAFPTPEDQVRLLMEIYQFARVGLAPHLRDLWLDPDMDLGRALGQDKESFMARFRQHFSPHGLTGLLQTDPTKTKLIFLASKLTDLK